jgi:CheY-like chemotaxis protein/HPt (histidine-containing phosphotransfer) domain-containing protein
VPSLGAADGARRSTRQLVVNADSPTVAAAASRAARPGSADPCPGGQGRRVLLAEDHPINREVIMRQLRKLGYVCECAEDGLQAWDMLQAATSGEPGAGYALLLTDCHMPQMDGYELTTWIRTQEASQGLPRLPIVALTADALSGEAERCLALGMDAYLSKPLELGDLCEALSQVLGDRRSARDVAVTEAGEAAPAPAAADPTAHAYARLMELCEGDVEKVASLVRVFVNTTEEDMKAMDRAAETADAEVLGHFAHRVSSACHQLDENTAFGALQQVERQAQTPGRPGRLQPQILQAYRSARGKLELAMQRAQAFISSFTPNPA